MELGKAMGMLIVCAVIILAAFWKIRKKLAVQMRETSSSKAVFRCSVAIAYVIYTLTLWLVCLILWFGIHLIMN